MTSDKAVLPKKERAATPEENIIRVVEFLKDHKLVLSVAESCTAGEVCSLIADVPGCGGVLYSGFVVYNEQAKQECLGVHAQTIRTFGLTSEEVAREMASGALSRQNDDTQNHDDAQRPNIALAITGTAESNDAEDGVVCFACAAVVENKLAILSETVRFEGSRNEVRSRAAHHAIDRLPRYYAQLRSN